MYMHTHTHTHAHGKEGGHPPGLLQTPDRTRRHTDTDTHTQTHIHTHTQHWNICLSAAIWFPSPCLFVDATRCMSRTVIDGPKRCPRSEGLTNQLPIKHHPLEDVRLVLIVSHELEDVRLVLLVFFHERWTAGVGGNRLVIPLAGGDERRTAAVGGSHLVIILVAH